MRARHVARAGDVVQHAGHGREDVVGGEMPDARVDRRQTVDVEDEERSICSRRPRACAADLTVEERMEGRAVVEIGQRVALGDGIGLAGLPATLSSVGRVMLRTFSSDVMSISLNLRSGVLVSTASIPGSFGESRSGIARPLRMGLASRGLS